MLRSEEDARRVLGPYFDRLYHCVVSAINEFRSDPNHASLLARITSRSKANVINDLIWDKLRVEFAEEVGFIFPKPYLNRREVHVGDAEFRLRAKKLNSRMRPQNIPTQMAMDFLFQVSQQLAFPGMEPPTNVDLCYRLVGPAELGIEVYLRCPAGHNAFWMLMIDEQAEGFGAGLAPVTPLTPKPLQPAPRVRPKRNEAEQEEEEKGEASGV